MKRPVYISFFGKHNLNVLRKLLTQSELWAQRDPFPLCACHYNFVQHQVSATPNIYVFHFFFFSEYTHAFDAKTTSQRLIMSEIFKIQFPRALTHELSVCFWSPSHSGAITSILHIARRKLRLPVGLRRSFTTRQSCFVPLARGVRTQHVR